MDNPRVRRGIGLLLVLVVAVIAVWLLLPSFDTEPRIALAPQPVAAPKPEPLPEVAVAVAEDPGEAELFILTPDGGKIPKTEKCNLIADWAQKNVPHHTIADNIRDRSFLFTEDDVACLTASDVPPFVLTHADMHMFRESKPR